LSSNFEANCYALATGSHKLDLSSIQASAASLKWLGKTGLAHDPSCDGCACDTK